LVIVIVLARRAGWSPLAAVHRQARKIGPAAPGPAAPEVIAEELVQSFGRLSGRDRSFATYHRVQIGACGHRQRTQLRPMRLGQGQQPSEHPFGVRNSAFLDQIDRAR